MRVIELAVGAVGLTATGTAAALVPLGQPLGLPLGVGLGSRLGGALGTRLGDLPIGGSGVLLLGAVALGIGIVLARRKRQR